MQKTMFQQRLTILLISSLIASSSFAYDVKLLKKGDPAPYAGIEFTLGSATQLSQKLQDCDKQTELNLSLNTSLELYKKNQDTLNSEVAELTKENNDLTKATADAESNSMWVKVMYFGLGIVTTGLIVYATRK